MNQSLKEKVTAKALEKTIKASIKREMTYSGINTTTRQGSKELKFLIHKISRYSFENLEQAQIAGEKLGQHLSELFQQRNKTNLDASLIRQLTYQNDLWSKAGLSVAEASAQETDSDPTDSSQTNTVEETEKIESAEETTAVSSASAEEISATETTAPDTVEQKETAEQSDETDTTDILSDSLA